MPFFKRKPAPRQKSPEELALAAEEKRLVFQAKQLALQGDPDAQAFLQMVLPSRGGRGNKAATFPGRPSQSDQMREMLEMFQLMQGITGGQRREEDDLERIVRYRKLMVELRKFDGGSGAGGETASGWAGLAQAFGQGVGMVLEKAAEKYGFGPDTELEEVEPGDERKLLAGPRKQPTAEEGEETEDVNMFKMFQVLRDARGNFEKMEPAAFAHWILTVDPDARGMAEEWAESTDEEVFDMLRLAKNKDTTLPPVKKFIALMLANPAKTQAICAALRAELGVDPTGGGTPIEAELAATGTDGAPPTLATIPPSKRTAL